MQSKRFLQTKFWAEFKGRHGWKPYYFFVKEDGTISTNNDEGTMLPFTVLVRSFSIKIKKLSLAYIPMSPEYTGGNINEYWSFLEKIALNLKSFLPKDTLFVRFDPPIDFTNLEDRDSCKNSLDVGKFRIKKSFVDIQPPDTVLLSLDKTEDELLSNMKSKWRYNIRLATKKGVTVSKHYGSDKNFEEAFEHFYELFRQTSERDGVSFHDKEYYKDLLKTPSSEDSPKITLYLAHHEEDFLAGIITLFCPREAVYLYGASGNIKRNFMPAYLLQWTAIQDAKNANCPVYDFYGMPPTDDENHPMHGLYLFKTGFGGTIIHRPGSFDVPLSSFYGFYKKAEQLRAWWYKKAVKKLKGR